MYQPLRAGIVKYWSSIEHLPHHLGLVASWHSHCIVKILLWRVFRRQVLCCLNKFTTTDLFLFKLSPTGSEFTDLVHQSLRAMSAASQSTLNWDITKAIIAVVESALVTKVFRAYRDHPRCRKTWSDSERTALARNSLKLIWTTDNISSASLPTSLSLWPDAQYDVQVVVNKRLPYS